MTVAIARPGKGPALLSARQRARLRTALVAAVVAAGDAARPDRLEHALVEAPVDALPAAAALHGLPGTVRRGVAALPTPPRALLERLATLQRQAELRHLLITGALGRIAPAFDGAGLSWAVLKGPVVASLHYPGIGERTYSDLDLLVGRKDFGRAASLLEDLGYVHKIRNWPLAERMLAGEIGLRRDGVDVDLHWHFHYSAEDREPYALDPDEMLERVRHVDLSAITAPTLDPVDTLITVAFHAARSGGHRLVWSKDIERSLAAESPDLDELVRRCDRYRVAPAVGLVLDRARAVIGADVPNEVVRVLTPPALLVADRTVRRVSHPVQLHERDTVARSLIRSPRPTLAATLAALPARSVRRLVRRVHPPAPHDTDDPVEKQAYFRAVARATRP